MSLIRPSGGLYWHWRAFRSRTHWLPFSREIARWLEGWKHPCKGLLLVGPSGGWSMSGEWLSQFETIRLIDPDASAQWIFRWRFKKYIKNQIFIWDQGRFEEWLPEQLERHPDHAVLFTNVLGQIRYERRDYERVLAPLPSLLKGRYWASYHDCLSSDPQPWREELAAFDAKGPFDEAMLSKLKLGGTWMDHGTMGLFSDSQSVRYIPWWFNRHRLHWVQAGIVNPEA